MYSCLKSGKQRVQRCCRNRKGFSGRRTRAAVASLRLVPSCPCMALQQSRCSRCLSRSLSTLIWMSKRARCCCMEWRMSLLRKGKCYLPMRARVDAAAVMATRPTIKSAVPIKRLAVRQGLLLRASPVTAFGASLGGSRFAASPTAAGAVFIIHCAQRQFRNKGMHPH